MYWAELMRLLGPAGIGNNWLSTEKRVVVFDQNIVTSQGPATPYPFAFKIAEVFGKDVTEMKERLMYNFAGGK